jgi:acyl-CoA thioesterase
MSQLDRSLTARSLEKDLFCAVADRAYEANTGMFGGWTAALLLKAVLQESALEGSPSALSVNFVQRVVPGEQVLIRRTRLGASRSLAHWRADLYRIDDDDLLASASVVVALRRPSESATDFPMPAAPLPEELPETHPPGPFGEHTDSRPVHGIPPFNRTDLRSLTWVRETSGRAVDAVQLAYLSDVYAPRVFHVSSAPRPSSTLTLSVYFLAGPDEMGALGDDYVLVEAGGTRIEQSLVGSHVRLWSRRGDLLATSEQLCWFK